MKKEKFQGYILRSSINPVCLLCTDGIFHAEMFVGASAMQNLSAKVYKRKSAAVKMAERKSATIEEYFN